jgi:hypothetical protein
LHPVREHRKVVEHSSVFSEVIPAFLGRSDPLLPTWGMLIYDALTNGLYLGYYYYAIEPVALLLTALAFALFDSALDRILNPRLKESQRTYFRQLDPDHQSETLIPLMLDNQLWV